MLFEEPLLSIPGIFISAYAQLPLGTEGLTVPEHCKAIRDTLLFFIIETKIHMRDTTIPPLSFFTDKLSEIHCQKLNSQANFFSLIDKKPMCAI